MSTEHSTTFELIEKMTYLKGNTSLNKIHGIGVMPTFEKNANVKNNIIGM